MGQSSQKNMALVKVELPYQQTTWKKTAVILKEIATQKIETPTDCLAKFVEAFSAYYNEHFDLSATPFLSLQYFFQNCVSPEEKDEFLMKSLPKIAEMALNAQEYEPKGGLKYSLSNVEVTVKLDRNYVAGLIALGFLCFHNFHTPKALHGRLTSLNFDNFLQPGYFKMKVKSQVSKLKCILHYYARLSDCGKDLQGEVTFHRVFLDKDNLPSSEDLRRSERPLCKVQVDPDRTIEDSGSETLQVDFANEYIGGGVLGGGNVQEEIRFCLCPELLVSMLFMCRMEPTEAIVMQGFEQFSQYTGYGGSFTYAGDYRDQSQKLEDGNLATTIVAIDAVPYYGDGSDQYRKNHIQRDIVKAYVGFLQPYITKEPKRVVATGNWGCGAFGGNPQLKSFLQWIAASEAECQGMIYYTFSDQYVLGLDKIVRQIKDADWKVKDLYNCIMDCCRNVRQHKANIFQHIEKVLATSVTEEQSAERGESKETVAPPKGNDSESSELATGKQDKGDPPSGEPPKATKDESEVLEVATGRRDKEHPRSDKNNTSTQQALGDQEMLGEKKSVEPGEVLPPNGGKSEAAEQAMEERHDGKSSESGVEREEEPMDTCHAATENKNGQAVSEQEAVLGEDSQCMETRI